MLSHPTTTSKNEKKKQIPKYKKTLRLKKTIQQEHTQQWNVSEIRPNNFHPNQDSLNRELKNVFLFSPMSSCW